MITRFNIGKFIIILLCKVRRISPFIVIKPVCMRSVYIYIDILDKNLYEQLDRYKLLENKALHSYCDWILNTDYKHNSRYYNKLLDDVYELKLLFNSIKKLSCTTSNNTEVDIYMLNIAFFEYISGVTRYSNVADIDEVEYINDVEYIDCFDVLDNDFEVI